ncbi:hypothetical protein ABZ686_06450 [Streptomyces sp. NPDC006992]|uniref:hypothetical protein n=1 Tax=unclassified Streptomyces TaxID=2593676 RepID=UPI0033F0EBA9
MDARQRRRWAWLTGTWAVLVATGGLLTVSWQQESASDGSGPGWYDAEDARRSGGGDGDISGNPMHGSVPVTPKPEEGERYGELRPSIRMIPPEGGFRDSVTVRPEPVPRDSRGSEVRPREWQPAPDPGTGY